MPRPRKILPRYLSHPSGKARVVWTSPAGRREKMLPGGFNSPESLQAFARFQLELASSPEKPAPSLNGPTVVEVLAPYLRYAAEYHGPGSEWKAIKSALKTVRELYGADAVADFGPKKLAACREAFVRMGWSRPYINRQTQKIVRAFKWGVAEELAPANVLQALRALAPLRLGHCPAPEPVPRLPADPAHVTTTLPFLGSHVRAIVELIRVTGMRPSEVCRMTLGQIDCSHPLWNYCPLRHKGAHRGHVRTVSLGNAAQAIIAAHIDRYPVGDAEPLFSPKRQRGGLLSKAKPQKRKAKTPRKLREEFTVNALGRAVGAGCVKAGVPGWTPYQLRHLKGAELRGQFSLEHVRAALGHSHASMTAHYAKGADGKLAAEVAAAVG